MSNIGARTEITDIRVILANPRGYCAGVDRAVLMVERALDIFGAPIYVKHEIVHNKFVVAQMEHKGAIFVEEIDDIPEGSICIFSAHGVSKKVKREAAARKLRVFDATCPLVTKVHMEVCKFSNQNRECILVGHAGHPEVEGTLGQYDEQASPQMKDTKSTKNTKRPKKINNNNKRGIYLVEDTEDARTIQVHNPDHLAYVTQTTLSLDDTQEIISILKQRFPKIKEPYKDDICYATQNRQNAVKRLATKCQLILVIGSANSSNSNRLYELAKRCGCASYLINTADELKPEWLHGISAVGITAGASAPEQLVMELMKRLEGMGISNFQEEKSEKEMVKFTLPRKLRPVQAPLGESKFSEALVNELGLPKSKAAGKHDEANQQAEQIIAAS